ncbi:MAG: sigma-70 family RNA polymerase sigma factor, partial [Polyangiales bacterium]
MTGHPPPPRRDPLAPPGSVPSAPRPHDPVVTGEGLVPIPTFREIYDDYFGFVWRSAANRGIPSSALDDVTQEVFIVVARKLPEFEGRSSARTWLAGIVRRVIADYVKKRGNQPAGDEPLEREPANANAPTAQHERDAALTLLDGLLAKMTAEQREVFLLHELEELSGP